MKNDASGGASWDAVVFESGHASGVSANGCQPASKVLPSQEGSTHSERPSQAFHVRRGSGTRLATNTLQKGPNQLQGAKGEAVKAGGAASHRGGSGRRAARLLGCCEESARLPVMDPSRQRLGPFKCLGEALHSRGAQARPLSAPSLSASICYSASSLEIITMHVGCTPAGCSSSQQLGCGQGLRSNLRPLPVRSVQASVLPQYRRRSLTRSGCSCALFHMCMDFWVYIRLCGPGRFTVAALAFSPFLKQAMASKRIWRGGAELGFWMALGEFSCIRQASKFTQSSPDSGSVTTPDSGSIISVVVLGKSSSTLP